MTIERLQAHYGFTLMPFGRSLAPQMLHRHASHAEATARIGWCISEGALGVVTGEVGAGKTVAVRAALAQLDPSRTTSIYLGNPAVGARGLYTGIVSALGAIPRFHKAALIPQTTELLARVETTEPWGVRVRPELVVEIALDGVQTSPRYPGGIALRFARVLRYRPDKTAAEADALADLLRLHVPT